MQVALLTILITREVISMALQKTAKLGAFEGDKSHWCFSYFTPHVTVCLSSNPPRFDPYR